MDSNLAQLMGDVREIKAIVSGMDKNIKKINGTVASNANRIDKLESNWDKVKGGSKILAVLAAAGTTIIGWFKYGG